MYFVFSMNEKNEHDASDLSLSITHTLLQTSYLLVVSFLAHYNKDGEDVKGMRITLDNLVICFIINWERNDKKVGVN
jgi:hypothetical protein